MYEIYGYILCFILKKCPFFKTGIYIYIHIYIYTYVKESKRTHRFSVTLSFAPKRSSDRKVAVGISLSMAPSAAPLAPSKAQSIWIAGRTKIFIVTAILKATVTTFTREKYVRDCGLVIAKRVIHLLTRILVGQHCPVSSSRRCQKLNSNILLSLNVSQIEKAKKWRRLLIEENCMHEVS